MQNEALLSGKTEPALPAMAARFRKLTSSRNIEKIRREVEVKYGFMPNAAYCRDLLAFVDEMTSQAAPVRGGGSLLGAVESLDDSAGLMGE